MSSQPTRPTTGWTTAGQHLRPLDPDPDLDEERRIDDVVSDDWIYPKHPSSAEAAAPDGAQHRRPVDAILL